MKALSKLLLAWLVYRMVAPSKAESANPPDGGGAENNGGAATPPGAQPRDSSIDPTAAVTDALIDAVTEGMEVTYQNRFQDKGAEVVAGFMVNIGAAAAILVGAQMVVSGGMVAFGPAVALVTVVIVLIAIVLDVMVFVDYWVSEDKRRAADAECMALLERAERGEGLYLTWFERLAYHRERGVRVNALTFAGANLQKYIDKTIQVNVETEGGKSVAKTVETVQALDAFYAEGGMAKLTRSAHTLLVCHPWIQAGQGRDPDAQIGDLSVVWDFMRANGTRFAAVLPKPLTTRGRTARALASGVVEPVNRETVVQEAVEDRTQDVEREGRGGPARNVNVD